MLTRGERWSVPPGASVSYGTRMTDPNSRTTINTTPRPNSHLLHRGVFAGGAGGSGFHWVSFGSPVGGAGSVTVIPAGVQISRPRADARRERTREPRSSRMTIAPQSAKTGPALGRGPAVLDTPHELVRVEDTSTALTLAKI